MACTCSCAARAWASLNNELLIGWGSGTPCGAKPGMRTEGCVILHSSGWVIRTRGRKRVARVAVGRYDAEQPGAGVGHAEREGQRTHAPLVASGEALHALQLPSLLVQTRQRQSLILRVEDVMHLHERRTGGVVARTVHCRAYPAEPRTRRKIVFPGVTELVRGAKGSSAVVRNSERSRHAGYLRLAAYGLLVSENSVMRR